MYCLSSAFCVTNRVVSKVLIIVRTLCLKMSLYEQNWIFTK